MRRIAISILVILSLTTIECVIRTIGGAYGSSQVAFEVFLVAVYASVLMGLIASLCSLFDSGLPHQHDKRPCIARCALAIYVAMLLLGHGNFLHTLTSLRGLFTTFMGIAAACAIGIIIVRMLRNITWLENHRVWIKLNVAALSSLSIIVALTISTGWPMTVGLVIGVSSVGSIVYSMVTSQRRSSSVNLVIYLASICSLGLMAYVKTPRHSQTKEDLPNILLVTIDTLRADHVGCYGYESGSTPTLDAIADSGCLFEDAVSNAVVTGPSHMTILSGLLPSQHGSMRNGIKFPSTLPNLAYVLSTQGYRTAAFVSGWTLNDAMSGLASHFDYYDDDLSRVTWIRDEAFDLQPIRFLAHISRGLGKEWHGNDRPAGATNDRLFDWLNRNSDAPFFVWVHYFDPHLPYEAPAPYDRMHDPNYEGPANGLWYKLGASQRSAIATNPRHMKHMLALYDGEISYADKQLGHVLEYLRKRKLDEQLLLAVTSDHGESMGEHDIFYGRRLYEPSLRVPLIMQFPGLSLAASRVSRQVSLVDIAPTILDALGVKDTPPMTGRSLIPLMRNDETALDIPTIATRVSHEGKPYAHWSVRQSGKKLIWHSSKWVNFLYQPETVLLYDLRADPDELLDLAETQEDILLPLMQTLQSFRMAPIQQGRQSNLKEDIERLKALGYVGD